MDSSADYYLIVGEADFIMPYPSVGFWVGELPTARGITAFKVIVFFS